MTDHDERNCKVVFHRETAFGRKPKTEIQVLRQTELFIEDEGRWVLGRLTNAIDLNPKTLYEKATCGKWGACLAGAAVLVSGVPEDVAPKVCKVPDYYIKDEYEYEWDIDPETALQSVVDDHKSLPVRALRYVNLAWQLRQNPDFLDILSDPAKRQNTPWGWWEVDYIFNLNDSTIADRTEILKLLQEAQALARRPTVRALMEKVCK